LREQEITEATEEFQSLVSSFSPVTLCLTGNDIGGASSGICGCGKMPRCVKKIDRPMISF
jgi:hypothetical protein